MRTVMRSLLVLILILFAGLQVATLSRAADPLVDVSASKTRIDFGIVVVGTESAKTRVLLSTEYQTRNISFDSFLWDQVRDFTVNPDISGILKLRRRRPTKLDFRCTPTKAGPVSANYWLSAVSPTIGVSLPLPKVKIGMKCTGVWRKTYGSLLKISQPRGDSVLDFDRVIVGKTNTKRLVIQNTSSMAKKIAVRWRAPPNEFLKQGKQKPAPRRVFDYGRIRNPFAGYIPRSFTIPGKSEISIEIKFTPRRDSRYYGVLEVIRDSSNRIEIGLFGTGIEG